MRRLFLAATLLAACGSEPLPAAEWGAELMDSPSLSTSRFNELACTSCHEVEAGDERILSGYTLRGAAARPSFWGGMSLDLKEAVDVCLVYFMKSDPLDPATDEARALYDRLVELGATGPNEALPFTVVQVIDRAPERGDAIRGEEVHRLACASCHGAAGSGAGRIEEAPILPDQAVEEAAVLFPGVDPAVVFTEKVRHGAFFGIGGTMPLYSLEALPDQDLGALLAFYGL